MSDLANEMAELEAMYDLPDMSGVIQVIKSADGHTEATIQNGAIVAITINSSCPPWVNRYPTSPEVRFVDYVDYVDHVAIPEEHA